MALITVQRTYSQIGEMGEIYRNIHVEECCERGASKPKIINECYFAVRGAALVLPHEECIHVCKRLSKNVANDIQKHLQSMFFRLRAEDTLKMAVKLESAHYGRTRYLVVLSSNVSSNNEESCLLGVDCNNDTTIGLVMPVWADTYITLDGDGGFSITSSGRHHIFKPVSVQAMWSALQTLHKVSAKARQYNYFAGGSTHNWVRYYEELINSDRSCLNEWHAMDDLVYKRPPSPDIRAKPSEQEAIETMIRAKLKEIMMSVDLDEVTSKFIRSKLETQMDMDLNEYKSFIDEEMLTILGQMDSASQIFDYLYLGSEWNASNFEELNGKGVEKILNVTREIDNFFPGMFDYYNVRVYDDDSTEMLKHWDKTFKYIRKAKEEGSKVLVHCKMGISRSASVVIAYVMKAYNWNLEKAMDFVKNKRNCIRPNASFLKQLEIYQGILDASKQRHSSLWRSKSETNLKSVNDNCLRKCQNEFTFDKNAIFKHSHVQSCNKENSVHFLMVPGSSERPKSWSPNDNIVGDFLSHLDVPSQRITSKDLKNRRSLIGRQRFCTDPSCYLILQSRKNIEGISNNALNCEEQNTDVNSQPNSSIVKERITEIETNPYTKNRSSITGEAVKINSKAGFVLNLANQFEPYTLSKNSDNNLSLMNKEVFSDMSNFESLQNITVHSKPPVPKHTLKQTMCVSHEKFDKKFLRSDFEDIRKTQSNRIISECPYSLNPCSSGNAFNNNNKTALKSKEKQCIDAESITKSHSITESSFMSYANAVHTKNTIESEIKRTASYDSLSCDYMSRVSDEKNIETELNISKSHRRSKSLYLSPHKLIPLPTLTSELGIPQNLFANCEPKQNYNLTQSRSTPSVIDAVNEVLSNTQMFLNSAFECIPEGKTITARTKDIDIKSQLLKDKSQINANLKCEYTKFDSLSLTEAKCAPEIENRKRFGSEDSSLCSKKNISVNAQRIIIDAQRKNVKKVESLSKVNSDSSSNGVVRRLTKELEAKAKEKDRGITSSDKLNKRQAFRQTSKSTPASPNVSRVARPRSSTFNEFMDEQSIGVPPVSFRKQSLDLSHRTIESDETSKQMNVLDMNAASSTKSASKVKRKAFLPHINQSSSVTHGSLITQQMHMKNTCEHTQKRTHNGKKQQGKSHPLSKLMP